MALGRTSDRGSEAQPEEEEDLEMIPGRTVSGIDITEFQSQSGRLADHKTTTPGGITTGGLSFSLEVQGNPY